ncbi:uncharacterized protein (DUF1499 family) [Scopulibacillus daqui]|uniref:Uncharacterized protein (DUF1499 family) n=1 Tax=Scopulibacillus daqui TaxID=1469162 RepID=A0ABS2Q164_9BACL|nr:DUF1499 domain-containing protein [Scopulibacillus daqui]MBM7645424.1 uncharacterized protein (DUF1499 family) [Scopulibacillus daqui]
MAKEKNSLLGIHEGKLAPCPRKFNCVSTEHPDLNRKMLPISYQSLTLSQAKELLIHTIKSLPKTEIKEQADQYIYVEFRTPILEFYHDAEFYFDDQQKEIHFRSVSRVGFADFGANKRWMQSVVARFLEAVPENE